MFYKDQIRKPSKFILFDHDQTKKLKVLLLDSEVIEKLQECILRSVPRGSSCKVLAYITIGLNSTFVKVFGALLPECQAL